MLKKNVIKLVKKYLPGELIEKPEPTGDIALGGVLLVSLGWDGL